MVSRYYPMLPAILEWRGKRSRPVEGILDSGSDGVVLPLSMAKYMGLELVEKKSTMRVVGAKIACYSARVNIIIGRAGNFCSPLEAVEVTVPKEEDDSPILFGRNPVFEHFTVTFYETEKRYSMEPCGRD